MINIIGRSGSILLLENLFSQQLTALAINSTSRLFCCHRNHYLLRMAYEKANLSADSTLSVTNDFGPPTCLKLMKELDRNKFSKTVKVPCIVVPQSLLNTVRKKLWNYILKLPKLIPILDHSTNNKVVLLDPKFVRGSEDCDDTVLKAVVGLIDFQKAYQVSELKLTYENWTVDDVLKAILPEGEGVSGFSIIGHIVHFNLKPCHEPYKKLIGQVILDKLRNVRSVVNKANTIHNVYRFFEIEHLAGDNDTVVTVKENGCYFHFDFAKVYWNSRLSTEHERVVEYVKNGDLLYDVFAGVGPFAIPCARKGATVLANDLNPDSYKWLNVNATLNSSKKYRTNIKTFNIDGRDFIRHIVSKDLPLREDFNGTIHIVMNLPALAVKFLDAFVDLYEPSEIADSVPVPTVHCYTFSKAQSDHHDFVADVRERIESVFGCKLPADHVIRKVRNVAPNKNMMYVSFRLLRTITVGNGSDAKKIKLEDI